MSEFFLSALAFGLASGIKPGPLGIIVIQQTLSRGLLAGVRASLAPLITDGPIILVAFWFLSKFKSIDLLVVALGVLGGLYLLWLAVRIFRVRDLSVSARLRSPGSLATAVKVNFVNPGPYTFWFTVGGSYIIRGTALESAVFVVTAIGSLIVAKIAMAVLALRFLPALESRGYLMVMRLLGLGMGGFGVLSLVRAVQLGWSGASA